LEDTVVAEKVEMHEDTEKPLVQLFVQELGFPEGIEGPADKLAGQQAVELGSTVAGLVELLEHIEEPAGWVELQRHTEQAEEAVNKLAA
jgi:hypothetical protein